MNGRVEKCVEYGNGCKRVWGGVGRSREEWSLLTTERREKWKVKRDDEKQRETTHLLIFLSSAVRRPFLLEIKSYS